MNNTFNITDYDKCYGCGACSDICPVGCISMDYDKYGFYIPVINNDRCIGCGICQKICPSNNEIRREPIRKIFKGYSKNIETEENQKSTSGAIFGLMAEKIIADNGVVIGVAFDEGFTNVSHVVCNSIKEIDDIRGSKYIQSKTQGIYKKVDELLKSDKNVLFSGTPCQIAGLYAYLDNIPDNLLTVDFVCHGVGSTGFFQEYVKNVSKGRSISHIGFRDKCGCYRQSKFRIIDNHNQEIICEIAYGKGFSKAFANNLIARKSCGSCKYATTKRVSDISLADNMIFISEYEEQYGSSFMFINTEKGIRFFELIKPYISSEELEKEVVIPKIMHLNHPSFPHCDRDKLFEAFATEGYEKASQYISNYKRKVD